MVQHVSIIRGVTSASAQPAMRERIAETVTGETYSSKIDDLRLKLI